MDMKEYFNFYSEKRTLNHNEIPLHTYYDGYTENDRDQQVSARMWRNWNPHTLLVEI